MSQEHATNMQQPKNAIDGDRPDALTSRVRHLRCENPSPMTLTGTNTYIIDNVGRVAIIDPGPDFDDEAPDHLDDIIAATAQMAAQVAAATTSETASDIGIDVLLTHHHPDHAGGLDALLARLTVGGHDVRVFGGTIGKFWPTEELVGDLRVIMAPGHTRDSVVLALPGEDVQVLFTGDTVLGGSSSFVAHPDGNLTDYLATLETLAQVSDEQPTVLAPGHGVVGGDASAAITQYRQHRADRLDEVRAALAQAGADASVEQVADMVYADVNPKLRPAVEAIVSAQLEHLRATESADASVLVDVYTQSRLRT